MAKLYDRVEQTNRKQAFNENVYGMCERKRGQKIIHENEHKKKKRQKIIVP